MKMNFKLNWYALIALLLPVLLIILLLLIMGIPSVYGQGPFQKSGELTGGYADYLTLSLKTGESIQGNIVARKASEPLSVSIQDPYNKVVQNFGALVNGNIYYVAKADGIYRLIIANTDTFAVGTRGYTVTYSVKPGIAISIPAPKPSVTAPTIPPPISNINISGSVGETLGIILIITVASVVFFVFIRPQFKYSSKKQAIAGFIVAGITFLVIAFIFFLDELMLFLTMLCVFGGLILAAVFTMKSNRSGGGGGGGGGGGRYPSADSDSRYPPREKQCERCGGTGTVRNLYIPLARDTCRKCKGVGWYYID